MKILAIDPGNVESAFVLVREDLSVIDKGKVPNEDLLEYLSEIPEETEVVIEMVASYGMPVGASVFETVFWIGRFYEVCYDCAKRSRIYRMDVKTHLCHAATAKDSNIRQALIDRFGEVGTKKNPGWFYGFKADIWSAYAVAVTYMDRVRENKERIE